MDEADKGLTDDHDRYEWANVSSVTGHPGCPGQNLQSCKTVVCVCVCLSYHMAITVWVFQVLVVKQNNSKTKWNLKWCFCVYTMGI